ncbi:MAG: hypothetical protein QG669_508 [Patescibacteria group bacterium]|jgi:hypothetical protein|nr:hypothetical protein [Patescibacteria group bacterium]MDQ5962115.1 hypothetical protein [Patescibacteria group bacterium]
MTTSKSINFTQEERLNLKGIRTHVLDLIPKNTNLTAEDILSNEKIHISKEFMEEMQKGLINLSQKRPKSIYKHILHDEMYDSEFLKRTGVKPYSIVDFLDVLVHLFRDSITHPAELNTNGTRDNLPENIFYVETNGHTDRYVLSQEKNSEYTDFLHWHLIKSQLDKYKLSHTNVVFSK